MTKLLIHENINIILICWILVLLSSFPPMFLYLRNVDKCYHTWYRLCSSPFPSVWLVDTYSSSSFMMTYFIVNIGQWWEHLFAHSLGNLVFLAYAITSNDVLFLLTFFIYFCLPVFLFSVIFPLPIWAIFYVLCMANYLYF